MLNLGKLKLTAIRLDDEDLEKAKKLGINISQVCRNAVKEAIRRMEGSNHQEEVVDCPETPRKDISWSLGRDLNPRPTTYEAAAPTELSYRGTIFHMPFEIFKQILLYF